MKLSLEGKDGACPGREEPEAFPGPFSLCPFRFRMLVSLSPRARSSRSASTYHSQLCPSSSAPQAPTPLKAVLKAALSLPQSMDVCMLKLDHVVTKGTFSFLGLQCWVLVGLWVAPPGYPAQSGGREGCMEEEGLDLLED